MKKPVISLALALALTACGGGTSDPLATTSSNSPINANELSNNQVANTPTNPSSPSGPAPSSGVSYFGFIDVMTNSDQSVEFNASFMTFPATFQASAFNFDRSTDQCDVVDPLDFSFDGIEDMNDLPATLTGQTISFVSAGDVLTVRSPAGSFTEIPKQAMFGSIFYGTDGNDSIAAPIPRNLVIDIPGDTFPAMPNVSIPSAPPVQVSSPASGAQVTANTTFRWTPNNVPGSTIDISATSMADGKFLTVNCTVKDDGTFTFPAATKNQMSGFNGVAELSRSVISMVQKGNAVLYISAESL